jgi:hypothetical protein
VGRKVPSGEEVAFQWGACAQKLKGLSRWVQVSGGPCFVIVISQIHRNTGN